MGVRGEGLGEGLIFKKLAEGRFEGGELLCILIIVVATGLYLYLCS